MKRLLLLSLMAFAVIISVAPQSGANGQLKPDIFIDDSSN